MKLKKAGATVIVSSLLLFCGVVTIDAASASKTHKISKYASLYGYCIGYKDTWTVGSNVIAKKTGQDKEGVIATVNGGVCNAVYGDKEYSVKKGKLKPGVNKIQEYDWFSNIFGQARYAFIRLDYQGNKVIEIKAKCE